MQSKELADWAVEQLEALKAVDLVCMDVQELTDITDWMIVCTGTSSRHVAALAQNLMTASKAENIKILGSEGLESGEWALVDFNQVMVHVMQPECRDRYQLEKLWQIRPSSTSDDALG